VVREWEIPKPIVLVDSREKYPFKLVDFHSNWIEGEKRVTLKTGDYSIVGMEKLIALERKSLSDVVNCTVGSRELFLKACARLSKFPWKAIIIEATYEDLKTPYNMLENMETEVHPNAVCGTLDAVEAKYGIPIIYTSRHRALATEKAASWLSKHFTYWWLEKNGHGRVLVDSDKL
jgi:ERCC4-type nuclease